MTDKEILAKLAHEYAQAAHECDHDYLSALYKGVNDLHMQRPIVLIDEVPWHEMNFDGSLTVQCEDPYLRSVETSMRRTLYQWKYFRADMIVAPFIGVSKVVEDSGVGVDADEKTIDKGDGNNIVAHEYHDVLATDEDLAKMHLPAVSYNEAETMRRFQLLGDMIGDIIPVKIVGHNSYFGPWDKIARLRGVMPLLMDLAANPEHSHKIIDMHTKINLSYVKQFEALNLYEPHPYLTHCTAALTDDLPGADFDPAHVKAKNCWGRGMAQIFSEVSREMMEEFEINYNRQVLEQFGLVYYGCCEPLHNKIDLVEKIPNLRKISITPWADVDVAAEVMGGRYVMSAKPNPSNLVGFDPATVREELTHIAQACARHNVSFELVLKDISTVSGRPQNLFEWQKIAMEIVTNL